MRAGPQLSWRSWFQLEASGWGHDGHGDLEYQEWQLQEQLLLQQWESLQQQQHGCFRHGGRAHIVEVLSGMPQQFLKLVQALVLVPVMHQQVRG